MNETKNIINPFIFYPTDKKVKALTRRFPLVYDQNTNTWIMEGNGIRLINIPNDMWVVSYLRDYVCTFHMQVENALRTSLIINNNSRSISICRIFAFLYGMIDFNDDSCLVNFKNIGYIDGDGIYIQDVSPNNINVPNNKQYLEDDWYAYIKIINANYYAKVNKEIVNYLCKECSNITYSQKKGVRATEHVNGYSSSLNNIVYTFFGGKYDPKSGVKALDYNIYHHDLLNIDYRDFTFQNLYSGSYFTEDDNFAYLHLPRYQLVAILDKWVFENHKEEFENQSWYIDSSSHVATNIMIDGKIKNGVGIHRFIFSLLCKDYNLELNMNSSDQIHHIDLDPLNNVINNLYLCGMNRHRSIHNYINNPYNSNGIDYTMMNKLDLKSNIIEVLTLGYIPNQYKEIVKF